MEPLWTFLAMAGATLLGTAAVLFVARHFAGLNSKPRRWGAFALAVGALGGFLAFYGLPTSPFSEDSLRATDRLFGALLLIGLLGLSTWRRSLSLAVLIVPGLVIAAHRDLGEHVFELIGLALCGQVLLETGDWAIRKRGGHQGSIQVGIVLAVVPAAMALSGSIAYAQWAGTLGISFGLITLLAWRDWDAGRLDGASAMAAMGAFALMAMRYSDLEPLHAGLLLGALPLSLLATAKLKKHQTLVGWLVFLGPIAIALALLAMAQEVDPYAEWR